MDKQTVRGDRVALALFVVGALVVGVVGWWPLTPTRAGQPQVKAEALQVAALFKPIALPNPKIPGFKFPEDETTILGWTKKPDQKAINLHGWGIWTALHMPSGEPFNNQELSVYETWLASTDILTAQATGVKNLAAIPRNPRPVALLRQFHRGPLAQANQPGDGTITGFVKYDPPAAQFILDQGLFKKATLSGLLAAKKTEVPAFPFPSISLKVVYKQISQGTLVGGRYFMLPAWPGPPPVPGAFGSQAWKQCVWVDVNEPGAGSGTGEVDIQCKPDGSSRTDKNTYGLGRFVYYRMSVADAQLTNTLHAAFPGERRAFAIAGDIKILVAMHVTSREITRWTWQTFWWTADPANPPAPSSQAIAADRPAELLNATGAAKNYAMSIGYDMLEPATPNTGGGDNGTPIFVYNPWLEAGFGPRDLPNSKAWTFQGKTYDNKFGMQTNCMSCHAQANYVNTPVPNAPVYTADRYVDLNSPQFMGTLKVDFLWSIPGNAQ